MHCFSASSTKKKLKLCFGSNNESEYWKCTVQQYTIAALASMIIGLIIFILITTRKCRIFRGKLFSNTVTWTPNSRSNYTAKKTIMEHSED